MTTLAFTFLVKNRCQNVALKLSQRVLELRDIFHVATSSGIHQGKAGVNSIARVNKLGKLLCITLLEAGDFAEAYKLALDYIVPADLEKVDQPWKWLVVNRVLCETTD